MTRTFKAFKTLDGTIVTISTDDPCYMRYVNTLERLPEQDFEIQITKENKEINEEQRYTEYWRKTDDQN